MSLREFIPLSRNCSLNSYNSLSVHDGCQKFRHRRLDMPDLLPMYIVNSDSIAIIGCMIWELLRDNRWKMLGSSLIKNPIWLELRDRSNAARCWLTVVRLPNQVDILARADHPGIVANTNYLIRSWAHQNVGEFLVVLLVGLVVDIDDFHFGYGMTKDRTIVDAAAEMKKNEGWRRRPARQKPRAESELTTDRRIPFFLTESVWPSSAISLALAVLCSSVYQFIYQLALLSIIGRCVFNPHISIIWRLFYKSSKTLYYNTSLCN